MKNTILNWSGGKDCAMVLYELIRMRHYSPVKFLTTLNHKKGTVPMHEIPEPLIDRQAESCGFAVEKIYLPHNASNAVYQEAMRNFWEKEKFAGNLVSAFGDIFLEDVRRYREQQLHKLGIEPLFPLWNRDTREIIREFTGLGFKAIITSADSRFFGKDVLGKQVDQAFIDSLPAEVDPCGEKGEFHTFVYNGPVFKFPVKFETTGTAFLKYPGQPDRGIWHLELTPEG